MDNKDLDKEIKDILIAKNISKTYNTGEVLVKALKECDLSFKEGQFCAIIGKSGSGKSTLLRILASLDKPNGGDIVIDGESIIKLNDKKLSMLRRQKIGFIYQDYGLFPEFNAYENIVMPLIYDNKKPNESEIDELLAQLDITHCKKKFPHQMSGGEQQRVSIARALASHPAVIFADEPTGNLDAESAANVAEMLSMASREYNQTIIMVTHDRQMAEYADRIITIADGVVS